MSIADIVAIIASLILIAFAFPALLFLITLTFPKLAERSKEQIETSPLSSMFLGLVIFVVLFFATVILFNIPGPAKLLALIILLATLSVAMVGGTGLINQLANKYEAFSSSPKSVANIFYSAFFLEFAVLLPLVGWFVVLPIIFCLMLGAGSKSILRRSKNYAKTPSIPQENFASEPVELRPIS